MKLTRQDIAKIEEELNYRKIELGPELREHLKAARAQGDLSENFEYTMAKRANNKNLSRIRYLEGIVRSAEIIEDHTSEDQVGLGKTVTIYIPEDDEEETYKLVSSIRGDSLKNRISTESPLGKALFGKKAGDTVTVKVNDTYSYDVVIRSITMEEDDNSDEIRPY